MHARSTLMGVLGMLAAGVGCSTPVGNSRTAADEVAVGFDLQRCEQVSCPETGSCAKPIHTPAVCLTAEKAPAPPPTGTAADARWVSPFVVELAPKRCASYVGFWCEPGRCTPPEPKVADCDDHRGIIVED